MIKHIKRIEIPMYLQQLQQLSQVVSFNDPENKFAKAVIKNQESIAQLSNSNNIGMAAYQNFNNEFMLLPEAKRTPQGQPENLKAYNDKFNELITLPKHKLAFMFWKEEFDWNIELVDEQPMSAQQLRCAEFMLNNESNKSILSL